MLTPGFYNLVDTALKSRRIQELTALNKELKEFNLVITAADAEEILDARSRALKNQGRIELDTSVTQSLLKRLSQSSYIIQENYIKYINDLYEVFHFIKNSTSDFISDDDIMDAIMIYFEKVCGGSTELLMGKGVEKITDNFKRGKKLTEIKKLTETTEDEENWESDE